MLLIAATSYNQSSRRTANDNQTAPRTKTRTNNASENSSAQVRDNNSRSGSRQTDANTHNSNRETETSTNRQHSATSTTDNRRNTQTSRSDNHQTNTQTGRSERPQTVETKPHRSATETHVRQTKPSGQVYNSSRQYRSSHVAVHTYHKPPQSRTYRAYHYAYRAPLNVNIIWTPAMQTHYVRMYPMVNHWNYNHGYQILNVSAYFAEYYMGDVTTVYGKVKEVYYSISTDEFFLYFGAYYPYQDFTVVMPGWIARQYSRRPDIYFEHNYLAVTGLITSFNGKPEIVVKESFQLNLY